MRTVSTAFEDYRLGAVRQFTGRTVTEADIVLHAGQTGDFFPHHMDAQWCASQPFGRRIAHGTLVMSIAVGMTAEDINPLSISYGYDRVRFIRPVFIGDTIHVTAEITGTRDHPRRVEVGLLDETVTVTNQHVETVLSLVHVYLVQRRPARQQKDESA